MACADGVDLLMPYAEGLLPAEARASVEAHLEGCPRCVAFVKSYLATPRVLRAATDAAIPAPAREALRRFLSGRGRS
jgi:anti-sigma factor RsiW